MHLTRRCAQHVHQELERACTSIKLLCVQLRYEYNECERKLEAETTATHRVLPDIDGTDPFVLYDMEPIQIHPTIYGGLYRATERKSGKQVAIKISCRWQQQQRPCGRISHVGREELNNRTHRSAEDPVAEADVLRQLTPPENRHHNNIVRLKAFHWSELLSGVVSLP